MSDLISRQSVLKAINNMVKECDSVYVTSALRNLEVIVADVPSAQPEPQKRGKGDVMVSDRELQVWQNGKALIIQSRYCDDPNFTLDQEKALYEIARSFLIVNRKRESDKRRKDRAKRKQEGE